MLGLMDCWGNTGLVGSSSPSRGRDDLGPASGCQLPQALTEVLDQRVAQHVLDRTVGSLGHIVLAAPRGHPQVDPVGRAVAGARKALRIDYRNAVKRKTHAYHVFIQ